jgi:hypothetical protein
VSRRIYSSLAQPVLPYSDPDLVAIGWSDRAVGPKRQDLYAGGYCAECGSAVGPRNDNPVCLSRAPKADICGLDERMSRLHFVSGVFLAALSRDELAEIEPRPVEFEKPSARRRDYFEVAGKPGLSQVGVRDGDYWRLAAMACATCGYRAFACSHPRLKDTARAKDFVARSDLPRRVDAAFLVRDSGGRTRICMDYARFEALAASLPGMALWPSRLFCLADDEVERTPDLACATQGVDGA